MAFDETTDTGGRGLDRRTLIKRAAIVGAAAWTAPAIIGSVASPAGAVSPTPGCYRYKISVNGFGGNSNQPRNGGCSPTTPVTGITCASDVWDGPSCGSNNYPTGTCGTPTFVRLNNNCEQGLTLTLPGACSCRITRAGGARSSCTVLTPNAQSVSFSGGTQSNPYRWYLFRIQCP